MAEAFAPSVGMDIGASNVTVKSGTSIDLSFAGRALGSMFEKPEATKLTEAEIKRQMWQPASEVLVRIDEDPNLSNVEKKIKKTKFLSSYVNDNPTLVSEANAYLGFQDTVEKNTMSPLDRTIMDWEEAADNKDLAAGYNLQSLNADGSRNVEKYRNLVVKSIELQTRQAELTTVTAANEAEGKNIWENDPKDGYQSYIALYDEDSKQVLNEQMVAKGLIAVGQSSAEVDPTTIQDNFVIPTINRLQDRERKAGEAMDRDAIKRKIDISSAEYMAQKKLALAPYADKIDFLNTNKDNFAEFSTRLKAIKETVTAQEAISGIEANKVIEKYATVYFGPAMAKALLATKEGQQVVMNQFVSASRDDFGKLVLDLKDMSKGKPAIGEVIASGLTPSSTQQSYINMYVPQTVMGQDGNAFKADVTVLSAEEQEQYKALPVAQKANVVKSGIAVMSRIDSVTTANIPYAMDVVGKTLNLSLMTDTPRLDAGQVKAFYKPDYFTFSEKIKGNVEPTVYEGFVQKADASVQMQLSKDWTEFRSQLSVVENALGGGKIFGVAIVDGKYVPTFVKNFEKTNPELRKKMMYSKITTPDELIKAYTGGIFGGSKVDPAKLKSSLDSINYLSTELIRLPPEVQANFTRSSSFAKEQMGIFNSEVGVSAFEASVEVAKVEPKIPEEFKTKLPQLMEYYDLKNKFIAADSPAERASLSQSLTVLKDSLGMQTKSEARDPSAGSSRNPWDLSFPDGKTDIAIEQMYQAKVSERLVSSAAGQQTTSMTVNPAANAPVAGAAPVETQGQAFAPRRIRFSDLIAGQTGGR